MNALYWYLVLSNFLSRSCVMLSIYRISPLIIFSVPTLSLVNSIICSLHKAQQKKKTAVKVKHPFIRHRREEQLIQNKGELMDEQNLSQPQGWQFTDNVSTRRSHFCFPFRMKTLGETETDCYQKVRTLGGFSAFWETIFIPIAISLPRK